MSFPRYPEYRDSGVDWLGEVPAHWGVSTIKRIVATPVTDGPHETPDFPSEGIPFVSAEAVSAGRINFDKIRGFISKEDHLRYSAKYRPRRGDIFMVKSGATTGVTAIVETDDDFNIWSPLAVVRCGEAADPYFVLNFMRSKNFIEAITLGWSFGTQQNIGMGVIENLAIPAPPVAEQRRIAAFLTAETAKIDALVEEQKRLIELLKEKRQAVISQSVTKGLDPSVPMKDSGVEWLGMVPAHWDVTPLKHVAEFASGGTPDKSRLDYWDGEIPWASAKDMKVDLLLDTADHITATALSDRVASLVASGTVLVVVRGMILARIFPVVTAGVPMAINQDLKAVCATAPGRNDWLAWLLRASEPETLKRLDEAGHGTKALRMDAWGDMRIPVPPPDEQQGIAVAIAGGCARIDDLIGESTGAMALLQERRSSLISAAVTGKIDVRRSS